MFLWLVVSLGLAKDCPDYACKSDSQDFPSGTCVVYKNTTEGKYYAHECPSDGPNNYCNIEERGNSYCIPKPVDYRFPGEKCDESKHLCHYGSECVDSRCKTKSQNCTSNYECEVGKFCNGTHCISQNNSLPCRNDSDCTNHYGCNRSSSALGKCVKYFSIQDYSEIQACNKNKSLLCNTGNCILHKGKFRCFGNAINKKAYPYTCDSHLCKSHVDESLNDAYLTQECSCGYNSEQKRVCPLFYQDDKGGNKYFRLLKDWYDSSHILKCHTEGRFSFQCMKEHWGDYDEFMYRHYKFEQYHLLYYAKDCVKKVFLPEFYHFDDEWDFASTLLVGFSLLTLL